MNRKYSFRTAFLTAMLGLSTSYVSAQSPYIHKVYDFQPAPGQFTNVLPPYAEGDTKAEMIAKADEALANDNQGMISLGGYGGYVVFGFDHAVQNVAGKLDFRVLGNAFAAASNPNPNVTSFGGSCEPGIVLVSYDTNGNGLPDDEWYELAGSEYYKPETIHDYRITYYKPDENKIRTPYNDYKYLNDTTYIRWTTNGYGNGYLYRNTFHNQSYYPQWIAEETIVFEGAKLADNYVDESGTGTYYVQYAYDYGYVDNFPNLHERSGLNIEWAVDSEGNHVDLPAIHFVKVYTGVNQYCGRLGETSTEILGAEDLHLTGKDIDDNFTTAIHRIESEQTLALLQNPVCENLVIRSENRQAAAVYDVSGKQLMTLTLESGTNHTACPLKSGFYLLKVKNQTIKFIKQ